jgi:hypothetical protein
LKSDTWGHSPDEQLSLPLIFNFPKDTQKEFIETKGKELKFEELFNIPRISEDLATHSVVDRLAEN